MNVGMVTAKNKVGGVFFISKDDKRLKTGELIPFTTGMVNVKDKDGRGFSVKINDERYLSGELVSANKGVHKRGTKLTQQAKKLLSKKNGTATNILDLSGDGFYIKTTNNENSNFYEECNSIDTPKNNSQECQDYYSKLYGMPIIIMDINKNILKTFCSIHKASKFLNINRSSIKRYLNTNKIFYKKRRNINLIGDGFYIVSGLKS